MSITTNVRGKNIMKNVNVVLEGEFKGKEVYYTSQQLRIVGGLPIEKKTVESYVVIDENNKDQYSFWKGALGVALLGGLGAIAGVRGKKRTEYLIAINWKKWTKAEGGKSLICIDDEYYKKFMMAMF